MKKSETKKSRATVPLTTVELNLSWSSSQISENDGPIWPTLNFFAPADDWTVWRLYNKIILQSARRVEYYPCAVRICYVESCNTGPSAKEYGHQPRQARFFRLYLLSRCL
jgi:hypothetical protein